MHIFLLRALGVRLRPTCFFNIVASEGGSIFDHQIEGSQKYCEVLSENHDPPIPKKMVAPLVWCPLRRHRPISSYMMGLQGAADKA